MELALVAAIAILALGGLLWRAMRQAEEDRDSHLRAMTATVDSMRFEREAFHQLASEMATRAQHPQIVRPDLVLTQEPSEPMEPDPAFEKVGKIFPESDNEHPDEPPDEAA